MRKTSTKRTTGKGAARSTGKRTRTTSTRTTSSSGKRTTTKRSTRSSRRWVRPEPAWAALSDEQLLDQRFCDLGLTIEGSILENRIARLYHEMERRGFRFRPHVWIGEDWFSPDNVPGIAIPFYLVHPRLMRLERKQMLDVEGGTDEECMRILRHEAGHTLDSAYRLHRRRKWRETFGRASDPYPDTYQPRPFSKKFVLHLDLWYAQSHPSEDFAETFAVWLKPRSRWRAQYEGWPALRKLEYVDQLMADIRDRTPAVRSRRHVDSVRTLRKTLREHYDERRARYGVDYPDVYDRELLRLFSDSEDNAHRPAAATFLRKIRPEVRRTVARWTGEYQYTIDQVIGELITRCRELDLRLARSEAATRQDAVVMLAVQTMNYLHGGHHRLAL